METSVKVKFRPSVADKREGTLYYQIIHQRVVRQLYTDYKIAPSEWDEKRSAIVIPPNKNRKPLLLSIRERIRWNMERLTKIVRRFDHDGLSYTADDVIDEFRRYAKEYTLFNL